MTAPGRRPRDEAATGGGTAALRGALLIGVAVVLGVVLLGSGLDSGIIPSSADGEDDVDVDVDGDGGNGDDGDLVDVTTTTAAIARAPGEVKVYVLNGSGAPGVAGTGAETAAAAGYQTAPAANVAEGQSVTSSVVYFVDGFEADAAAVATVLGIPLSQDTVQPLPTPLPPTIPDGDVRGANVIVILGPDVAPPG